MRWIRSLAAIVMPSNSHPWRTSANSYRFITILLMTDATLDRLFNDSVQRFRPSFKVSKGCEGAVFELGKQ